MVTDEVEQAVSDQTAGFVIVRRDSDPHDCHEDLRGAVRRRESARRDGQPTNVRAADRILGYGSEWHCPKCGSRWRKMRIVIRLNLWTGLIEVFNVDWYPVRWWHHKEGQS